MKHGWTLTRQPRMVPQRCAVFPHVKTASYIDTGMSIVGHDPHVYISDVAAKELGEFVGLVPRAKVTTVAEKLSQAEARIADLESQVASLEEFKAAVKLVTVSIPNGD